MTNKKIASYLEEVNPPKENNKIKLLKEFIFYFCLIYTIQDLIYIFA